MRTCTDDIEDKDGMRSIWPRNLEMIEETQDKFGAGVIPETVLEVRKNFNFVAWT